MEIFMKEDDLIVSKTDLKGNITYGNETFIKMSGYDEAELLSSPHNILRHQDMPKIVFKLLWNRIQNKQAINAYVINKTKQDNYYWVFSNVTASVDENNNIIGYHSARRKPSKNGVETIKELYKELLHLEKTKGIDDAQKYLYSILDNEGVSYDEFIINLQK